MGRAGLSAGTSCTDTPEEDVVILVEEDNDEDEEPLVLEESSLAGGLMSDVLRLNVSPRSVPKCVSVNTCCPPPP